MHKPMHLLSRHAFHAHDSHTDCAQTHCQVFAAVHKVPEDELCVSLDSFSLQMTGHPTRGLPLHDDQAAGVDDRSDMYSVQVSVNSV